MPKPHNHQSTHIALLATGGTIATPVNYPDAERLDAGQLLDKIRHRSPLDGVSVTGYDFSSVPSSRLNAGDILRLKEECETAADEGADGLVITHGTDMLEETAFLLSRLWQRPQPIAVTGAMRPAGSAGEDGPRNLAAACLAAASTAAAELGTMVVMNEEIHAAWEVTKGHTWALDSFVSDHGPVGYVGPGAAVTLTRRPERPRILPTPKDLTGRVVVLQAGMGSDESEIRAALQDDIAGIVVQAAGRGALPVGMYRALQDAASGGTLVVVTSRCPFGPTRSRPTGDHLIWAGRYNAVKSRILLMLTLSLWGQDRKKAMSLFG